MRKEFTMAKIIKQFSKQIIPFSYKIKDPDSFYQRKIEGKEKNIWNEYVFNKNHLFDHIVQKQETESPQRVLKTLILDDAARSMLSLPGANSIMFLSVRGKQSERLLKIKLKNIFLHLFETHVGFLEYDWTYMEENVNEYLNANYFLSELKSKENILRVKTGKDSFSDMPLESIVNPIFNLFDEVVSFDRREKISFYDLKPILFSAVLLDKKDEDFEEILNHASHNFKQSYQMETTAPCAIFRNSRWCGSETAMINVSYLVEDKHTNEFFTSQFINNVRNSYFYLYLLTLNQKFTLLKRISQIAKINPKIAADNEDALKEQTVSVSGLIGKTQLYQTRCNFLCPSSVDHINLYYEYARNSQKIDLFERELEEKINSLKQLLATFQKQLTDFQEYHHTKMLFIVFLLTQFIGSIAMFNSTCNILEDLFGFPIRERMEFIWIPIIMTLLFLVGVGIQVVLKFRDLRKQKAKLTKKK